ncbi:MAG TPA: helix-turn-helix transcriptional regulator [Myxococcota bacterium]|nr:helix-turn-helix transcriptional regulator [Myxococcota bacterium]
MVAPFLPMDPEAAANAPEIERIAWAGTTYSLTGFSLCCVERGALRLRLADGECVRLDSGDLLVVPLGASCELRAAWGLGEIALLRATASWLATAFALARRSAEGPASVRIARAGTDSARRATRLVGELAGQPFSQAPLRSVARVLELLALADELGPGPLVPGLPRRSRGKGRRFQEALASAARAPLDELSMATLAARVGVSERQASRLFHAELGMSFRDWATGLRLERAQALLVETELPIIEVGAETGWSSLAHFTSLFRRRSGMTPSAYRARHRRPESTLS